MTVFWDLGARKAAGIRRHYLGTLVRDAGPAFVSVVLVAIAVYLVSWTGWFLGGDDAYLRYWAKDNPVRRCCRTLCAASCTTTRKRSTST